MANQQEVSKTEEAESNARVIRLMKRVEQSSKKTTVGENNNIVAFVGPTKAGKSTLINCLLGTQLICKMNENTEKTFIIKVEDESGPKIGGSGESKTESPECWGKMADTNIELWDFAGFGDNKGTEQEIVNAISYQTILLAAESVCFVLVVPCYMIKIDDPLPFYKLLNELHNICPGIADSLCITFTKFDKGKVKEMLEEATSHTFKKAEQGNIDIINQGKIIIKKILENNNYIDFKAPKMEEGEEDKIFTLPNKQQFIDCISKLRGTKVKDFPLVISDQAKHVIAELYTVFYQIVKNEVENMNYFMDKYIQCKIDEIQEAKEEDGQPTSAASRLAHFKIGKSKIEDIIEKSKNFKTFFSEIEKLGMGNKMILEIIEKFAFTERLKNMYKKNDTENFARGESLFFQNLMVALNSGAQKYSDLIVASEAATEEEKKKEKQWEELNKHTINVMQEKINVLQAANNTIQVKLTDELIELVKQHAVDRQKMEMRINDQNVVIEKVKADLNNLYHEKEKMEKEIKERNDVIQQNNIKLDNTTLEKKDLEKKLALEKENKENIEKKLVIVKTELHEKENTIKKQTEQLKAKWCIISLVKHINYNNPLINKPLLLKSFSDLYGTKALSYLISLTEVLSEDSSESLKEICGSPHALEMFATMIGLS